jgi:hypothetical protein
MRRPLTLRGTAARRRRGCSSRAGGELSSRLTARWIAVGYELPIFARVAELLERPQHGGGEMDERCRIGFQAWLDFVDLRLELALLMKELLGGLTFEDGIDSGGVESVAGAAHPSRFFCTGHSPPGSTSTSHGFSSSSSRRVGSTSSARERRRLSSLWFIHRARRWRSVIENRMPRPGVPPLPHHGPGASTVQQSLDDLGGPVTRLSEDPGEEAIRRSQGPVATGDRPGPFPGEAPASPGSPAGRVARADSAPRRIRASSRSRPWRKRIQPR